MKKSSITSLVMVLPICLMLAPQAGWSQVEPLGGEPPAGEPPKPEEPKVSKAEFNLGVEAYKTRDYKAAETHFRQAIEGGDRAAGVWLYAGHTFLALGQYDRAVSTYEVVTKSFKTSPEAKIAEQGIESAKKKMAAKAGTKVAAKPGEKKSPGAQKAGPSAPLAAGDGLRDRISVVPPMKGHPPVSPGTVSGVRNAVDGIPKPLLRVLDTSGAAIVLAPNMIDKWPDSDLDEESDELNLAELPGRIYGKEMYIYERAKVRGVNELKSPRSVSEIRHTALNMCFQILDDEMKISTDPKLRKEYNFDVNNCPIESLNAMKTFLKEDDWGPRETCSELAAAMLGQPDEQTNELNKCFPMTRKWLKTKLGL